MTAFTSGHSPSACLRVIHILVITKNELGTYREWGDGEVRTGNCVCSYGVGGDWHEGGGWSHRHFNSRSDLVHDTLHLRTWCTYPPTHLRGNDILCLIPSETACILKDALPVGPVDTLQLGRHRALHRLYLVTTVCPPQYITGAWMRGRGMEGETDPQNEHTVCTSAQLVH